MKKLLLAFFILSLAIPSSATHLIGGEMRYEYLGPGTTPNSKQYRIRLLLFRGPGGATFINQYIVGVFNNDNGQKIFGPAANSNWAAVQDFTTPLPVPINVSPCIQNPPNLQYTYKTYSFVIELADNNAGYTVAFQTYSRQNSQNILNDQGATYSCVIPGSTALPPPLTDNSPQFNLPVNVVCANSSFALDFSATDVDGDSLVYSFCNAYNGGAATFADYQDPAGPPYGSVNYIFPMTPSAPLGAQATIDPHTGVISGVAPDAGKYVVVVCISYYRNGVLRGVHRKDLIVEVSPCIPTQAQPMPDYITCDGFNVQFYHSSTGAADVFWDFGYPGIDNDTSILDNPVFVYPDTGVFTVTFIINKGGNCTDTARTTIRVFPGFFPGFESAAPYCVGVPVQFNDTTKTNYGVVDTWSWNFGDGTTLADTSHDMLPTYAFPAAGQYPVTLVVTNSKGCTKTVSDIITVIDNPALSVFPADTSYCGLDSLQLTGVGMGNFSWSPNNQILNANTANPLVFPTVETTYYATLESMGCRTVDSIKVTPVFDLSTAITANPANICAGDTLTLSGSSNQSVGVTWQWDNQPTISLPSSQITEAYPTSNTSYTLTTTWGEHCIATATQQINVTPLAIPEAGIDTSYCIGQGGVELQASGGATYQWTPVEGLSDPNIANPIATPTTTTKYFVSVGVTGCARRTIDSVTVHVRERPTLEMPRDTLICIIDTLQLNAIGTGDFAWTPNYMISNTSVIDPQVSPDAPTTYYVRLTDQFGCYREDSVFVDVKSDVTVNAGMDTSICRTDNFVMAATGDGLSYSWSPAAGLNDSTLLNPIATPDTTTDYILTANIGKCQRSSNIRVVVAPYPLADAGLDPSVCIGFDAQLTATGGSSYQWSPPVFLSDPNAQNPQVIQPTTTQQYIVAVTDTLGCIKTVRDTVVVHVVQHLNVSAGPADTTMVEGEPLLLNASGALTYVWTPNQYLSNAASGTTVATPPDNITYYVTGTDAIGCTGSDSINIQVYRVDPDMYVPTAFTPNNDGLNDVIKPVLLGMKSLNYFRVYNRLGQLVFSTTEKGKGWNGIFNGKPQDIGTFVWMAEGITFKGQTKQKKGYVVLIR